ncbi:SSS family solute:Na+ symporter [Tamaricihabitans halophyticus]|uniref:SSS family solute:Na+ symporter n=1 Tax=Tamaricihabitans halophyticus TaxID=1262583 RepID=A0A4R2PX64_9PSEU|nr:sodium:solute symporter family protein [Tamaricihabitans halophyticus]TCP40763.1 SSS family solute:Na+ symporter [Tamaricihabitans halophyticus]
MNVLDGIGIFAYFVAVLVIGVTTMRRISNPADFAVAGNRIVWPVLFATLAASFLGGGASLGRAGESFSSGYAFMFAAIAFPIQTILVGYFVAPKLKRYQGAETVGDIMGRHYGKPVRLLTGVISMVYCIGLLGTQVLALGTVVNTIFGIPTTVGVIVGMTLVLVYSTAGGMWATVQTDVLQFAMLGVLLPVALMVGIGSAGGVSGLLERIPETHLSFFGDYGLIAFIGLFLAFGFGEMLIPPYAQRALSAPDPTNARKGYASAGVFGLFFYFVSASLGLVALVLFPNIDPDQALPTVVREILPVGLTGLVVAGLLAVVMSSADSYLNSTTVVFAKDIFTTFINPKVEGRRLLRYERVTNVFVGVAAIVFALSVPSIVDALLYSYTLWAPTVVVPLVLAVLFGVRAPKAAMAAMLAGMLCTSVWTWLLEEPFGITGLIVGLLGNAVTFTVIAVTADRRRPVLAHGGEA